MKLRKPNPEVMARLAQNENDHFVSAGRHRKQQALAVNDVAVITQRQILVRRVSKNRFPLKASKLKKPSSSHPLKKTTFSNVAERNTFVE